MNVQQAATFVVAQAPPGPPGGQGEDFGKSSPLGLLLLVLFGIAVAFLVRSMSKHLKKLPTSFDEVKAAAAAPARAKRAEERAAAKHAEGGETREGAEAERDGEAGRGSADGEHREHEPGEAECENGSAPTA